MPNHITNRITIIAENDRIREILEAIKHEEYGLGSIDFEKIIPPPAGIYRGNVGQEEQRKYGNNTMLDFGCEKWNTKWNAYGYDIFFPYEGGGEIQFLTAWSRPEPVVVKLSQMFPDVQFHHAWADEDIGCNVGEILYQDGEELEYDVPTHHSKEACEMSAEIQDLELSEIDLFYNEKTGSYEYREYEEEFSVADIHLSPDFQSDQTEGFPASLCWDTSRGIAFLTLNESMVDDETDLGHYEKLCGDFGNRPCADRDDFNAILEELGEDAVQSAWLPDQNATEEFGGMSLQ